MRDMLIATVVSIVVAATLIFGLATPQQVEPAERVDVLRPATAPLAIPEAGPASVTAYQPDDEIDYAQLESIHADHVMTFASADGFGERRIVHMPTTISNKKSMLYLVKDLDLIGFMQANTKDESLEQLTYSEVLARAAVVHDFQTIRPTRKMVKNAGRRVMTAFERRALKRIVAGEEMVAEIVNGKLHAVGALRAAKDCMECHQVKENTLLGAFAYEFDQNNRMRHLLDIIGRMKTGHEAIEEIEVELGKELLRQAEPAPLQSFPQTKDAD